MMIQYISLFLLTLTTAHAGGVRDILATEANCSSYNGDMMGAAIKGTLGLSFKTALKNTDVSEAKGKNCQLSFIVPSSESYSKDAQYGCYSLLMYDEKNEISLIMVNIFETPSDVKITCRAESSAELSKLTLGNIEDEFKGLIQFYTAE